MGRNFNGTSDGLAGSLVALGGAGAAASFTCCVAYKATAVSKGAADFLMSNGTGAGRFDCRHNGANLSLIASGVATGSNLAVPDATDWHYYIWRLDPGAYRGWVDTALTTFSTSHSDAVTALSGTTFAIGHDGATNFVAGGIGHVGFWNVALCDAFIDELGRGVAPDQFPGGLTEYFPVFGTRSPELSYATAQTLTVTGTTTITGPRIVPSLYRTRTEPAWVLKITKGGTDTWAATRDLYSDADVDVLGAAMPGRILGDVSVLETIPDGGGIVDGGRTVAQVLTTDGGFSLSTDYSGDGAVLYKYDRISHALDTAWVGQVDHQVMTEPGVLRLDLRSDDPTLDTLVPKGTIDIPVSTDGSGANGVKDPADSTVIPAQTGPPVPIACGHGGIGVLPFLNEDLGDPGGGRFLASYGPFTRIRGLFMDTEADQPGLELLALWETDPAGTPTYASSATFTVSGISVDLHYAVGTLIRHSTDSGSSWDATYVASITGSGPWTVTVSDAVLTSPLDNAGANLFNTSGEAIVETDKRDWVSASGTTNLTTVLLPDFPRGARVVSEMQTSLRRDPIDLIQFIIENADMGMGGTLSASDYAAAGIATAAAGIDTAIATVLGGDGRQRTARSYLNEIAQYRGMKFYRDEAGEWRLEVDTLYDDVELTVGYGAGTPGNLLQLQAYDYLPVSESTSALKMRYAAGGRTRGSKPMEQEDYAYTVQMGVHSVGTERTFASALLRDHTTSTSTADPSQRVLYYIGKRMEHSRKRGVLVCDADAWRIRTNRKVRDADRGENYRVLTKQHTLTAYTLSVNGPHSNEMYNTTAETIAAAVSKPFATSSPDENSNGGADGVNLLQNPDFSGRINGDFLTIGSPDGSILPGFLLLATNNLASLSTVPDVDTIGGGYLDFSTVASFGGTLILQTPGTLFTAGIPIQANVPMIFSAYVNTDGAGGSITGFTIEIAWFSGAAAVSTSVLDLRTIPGDVNPKGWRRVWGMARPAATATNCTVLVKPAEVSTNYQFDAMKLERRVSLFSMRPTAWSSNPRFGVQPEQSQAGTQSTRAIGSTAQASQSSLTTGPSYGTTAASGTPIGSGTQVTIATHAGGMFRSISGRVTKLIATTGSDTTFDIYEDATDRKVAGGIAFALNTGFDDDDMTVAQPFRMASGTNLYAKTPNGDTFSDGKIRAAIAADKAVPPETTI